ncbi:hypothetical protein CWI38_0031p0020 [Hamiltosporidium tvaerminnensis]|uniref:Leucine-rich repeat-containing protein n=1 Tax=Hamiltosporidium tvaerminnensis TaxID=1176355 RepID=A0A4Q9M560_9MICR|nr:hypothetical protein CWI38_0031p0020 [Hamiltosporidium tvaerminnensis]
MRLTIKVAFAISEFIAYLFFLISIDEVTANKVVFIFSEFGKEYSIVEKNNLERNFKSETTFPKNSYLDKKRRSYNINASKKIKLSNKIFVVDNIEKYPLRFLKITDEIYNSQKKINIFLNNSKLAEYIQFDNFMKTYYSPQKSFSVENFMYILYLLNYLKVEFNTDLKKIIYSLINNLKNLCFKPENCFDEIICKFIITDEFSFTLFKFVLSEFKISYFYENELLLTFFYETVDYMLPNRNNYFFGNENKRILFYFVTKPQNIDSVILYHVEINESLIFQRFSYSFVETLYQPFDDKLFGKLKENRPGEDEMGNERSKFLFLKNFNPKETKFFKTEDNNLYELNIEFINVIFDKFIVNNEYLNKNINILNFKNSKIDYNELLEISSVLTLKEIEKTKCEIIESKKIRKLSQKNFSVTSLQIYDTRISNMNKIYDFIHSLKNLNYLDLSNNTSKNFVENIPNSISRTEKNLDVFFFSNMLRAVWEIKEVSYFFGSKRITLGKISIPYFFKILFLNEELKNLDSLSLSECDFTHDDKESFCFTNINEIEFFNCKIHKLEFHELFSRNIKYSINSVTINNLDHMSFENCSLTAPAIFAFNRCDFKHLRFFTIEYSNDVGLSAEHFIHIYEEFGDIM